MKLSIDEIREAYTGEADVYNARRFESKVGQYYLEVERIKILKNLKPSKVLELGTGTGRYAVFLARHGFDYTGIDITPPMMGIARRKAKKAGVVLDLRVMDAHELDFEDATFDSVFCDRTFKFFHDPIKVLKEVHRVLKLGGRIVIDTEAKMLFGKLPIAKIFDVLNRYVISNHFSFKNPFPIPQKCYSKKEMDKMFKKVGFRVLKNMKILSFPPLLVHMLPPSLLIVLSKYEIELEKELLGRGAKVFIVGEKANARFQTKDLR